MPFCKFCVHADLYKRDNHNCVLCKPEGKYYYQAEQLNHCGDYKPTDRASYNDNYELKKANEKLGYKEKSNGCFITTTLCNILNYEDNSEVLNTLRRLRDNYMIGKEEYNDLLVEYYVVGPIISDCLLKEKEKFVVAESLYQKYILPACKLVINNKNEDAIIQYISMVDELKTRYQIPDVKIEYDHNVKLNNKEDFKKLVRTIK